MNRPPKSKALERLRKALGEIPGLKEKRHGSPAFEKWHRNAQVAIANTFGSESRHAADFNGVDYSLMAFTDVTPDASFQQAYVNGLESAASVLESMIEEVEEYWDEDNYNLPPSQPRAAGQESNKVFIIHGQDDGTKETVARFISTLGLQAVILHEKPNEGRTIIEKVERHSDVRFAVALLTTDDLGALQGHQGHLKPRARQNVIFEFGYFMGRLGRDHVCALLKGNVEIPSDYSGVMYIPMDISGGWKMQLTKELKAAKFEVDANRVL